MVRQESPTIIPSSAGARGMHAQSRADVGLSTLELSSEDEGVSALPAHMNAAANEYKS